MRQNFKVLINLQFWLFSLEVEFKYRSNVWPILRLRCLQILVASCAFKNETLLEILKCNSFVQIKEKPCFFLFYLFILNKWGLKTTWNVKRIDRILWNIKCEDHAQYVVPGDPRNVYTQFRTSLRNCRESRVESTKSRVETN